MAIPHRLLCRWAIIDLEGEKIHEKDCCGPSGAVIAAGRCFGRKPDSVVVGATTSPHAEILELVKDDMAALGYDLQIVEFTDYNLPNDALANNELDANYFQHLPFLNAYNATVSEENQLVAVIPVHYEPYGIYAARRSLWTNCRMAPRLPSPTIPATRLVPCSCCSLPA